MIKKRTAAQIAERLLYLLAVAVIPSIPLFFLYRQNAAQGLQFSHFLIFGGMLAAISLVLYLLVSKFALRRRRAMILIALFWACFWFFDFFRKVITRGNEGFSQVRVVAYLLIFIVIAGFILRWIKINRLAANTIALILCLLFTFNFMPEAMTVIAIEKQKAENQASGVLPYDVMSDFYVNPNLPHPNVYWLHMDGMVGFDAVERYFGDPQTELYNELTERGFVVNKSARLEAGFTYVAIPAMTSPVFYDSYLSEELNRVAQQTRVHRVNSLNKIMVEKGFYLIDIFPKNEMLKAFSRAGYINIGKYPIITQSEVIDIEIEDNNAIIDLKMKREADTVFNRISDFKDLITNASALIVIKPKIDEIIEKKRPVGNAQQIPEYHEAVDKYISGFSDSDGNMSNIVREIKYATSVTTPHFIYYINMTAHYGEFETEIGSITYEEPIGSTYYLDEYGNYYKEKLDDPLDVQLYYPQHKYTVKQMMAQIDTIIDNDPEAVIVVQADHGIHGYGQHTYDSKAMEVRGYNLEDQLNLTFQVISAVRVPPRYGMLTQPLDPLDIARYLVNNFVGEGNYDYLYYKEEGNSK